ncbi:MAG: acyl-CoA thioesterase [Elusimicrobia bacterium]|nr:acyl-CoA thioesterase [Elusimicrobiota bacterium]
MEGYRLVSEVPVRFSDTDGLGHVNNANYLSFLEVSRVDYLRRVLGRVRVEDLGVIIARIEIDYKSPVMHHETLLVGCRVSEIGGASIKMDYRLEAKGDGRLVAEAKSVLVTFDYSLNRPQRVSEEWRTKMEEFDGIS